MNKNIFDSSSDNPSSEFEPINTVMSEQLNNEFENYMGGLLMGGGENILNVAYEQSGGLFGMGKKKTVPATNQAQPEVHSSAEKVSRSHAKSAVRSGTPSSVELSDAQAGEIVLEGYSSTNPASILRKKDGTLDVGSGKPRGDITDRSGRPTGGIFSSKAVFQQVNKGSVVMSLTSSQLHQHMVSVEKIGMVSGMKIDTSDAVYQARLKQLLSTRRDPFWRSIKLFNMEQVIPSKATDCKLIIYEEQFNELNAKLSDEYRLREQKIIDLLQKLYNDIKEELRGPYESIKKIAMRVLGEHVIGDVVNTQGEQITNKIGLTNARLYIQEQLDLIKDATKLNKYTRRRRWISKHYDELMNAPIPRDQRGNELFSKQPPLDSDKEIKEETKDDPRSDDDPIGMEGKPPDTIETLKILLLHEGTYVTSELHDVYFKKGKLYSLQTKKSISLNDICVWISSGDNVVSLTPDKSQFSEQDTVVDRINKLREMTPYTPPADEDTIGATPVLQPPPAAAKFMPTSSAYPPPTAPQAAQNLQQQGGRLTDQQKLAKIQHRKIKKISRD